MNNKRTPGFWIIMVTGILSVALFIAGQTASFINYDFTVSIGLQEPKEKITEMGVAVNKGFGVGDTLIYIPLIVLGLFGLWKRKFLGLLTMSGAFAITAYWPIVCMFMLLFARGAPGFNFTRFTSYTITLGLFVLYGLWGLWYLYKNRKILTSD